MSEAGPILRVLTGAAAGATKSLPASGRVMIGHEFWHDVVLRDPSTRGIAVELSFDGQGVAQLTVLEGGAHMLGTVVSAGSSAVLPPFVPLRIGQIELAWGEAESERWRDADALVERAEAPPAPVSEQQAAMDALADRWNAGPDKLFRRVRKPALAIGVAAVVGLLLVPPAVNAIQFGIGNEYRARRVIDNAGFKRLRVEQRDGQTQIVGIVSTDGDRLRLQQALTQADVDATLAVQTSAGLARAVADVARLNGVQAEARPQADGTITLATPPIDDQTRDRLTQVLRRDVPGLRVLRFAEDLAIPRTVSEATKRVASVVTGDPPYILTEDGARYFSGALLPSGYYLVAIEGNHVLLDRRGKKLSVKF